MYQMYQTPTQAQIHAAIANAHAERAKAFRSGLVWMVSALGFGRKTDAHRPGMAHA